MAVTDRRPPPPLSQELAESPASFSFFQAVRLLRYYVGLETGTVLDEFLRNHLRVRPQLSLGFPGTDIVALNRQLLDDEEVRFNITTSFMGLYGASSPLPTFYTEDLLDDASDDLDVVRDFLDIVNYPLFPLIILAWSKYRLYIKVLDEKDPEYFERLFCLLGVGLEEVRRSARRSYEMLRYIGLFSQWPRSAKGLQTLLSDATETEKVEVEQCVLRRVKIPMDQRLKLGELNSELGCDAYLGEEVDDRMGKIHVTVGPMPEQKYHAYLPGSENFQAVCDLIRFYALEPVDFDLELSLDPLEAQPARLGHGKWSALGYDMWLLGNGPPEKTSAVFPMVYFNM